MKNSAFLGGFIFSCAYGVLDEFHQKFVPVGLLMFMTSSLTQGARCFMWRLPGCCSAGIMMRVTSRVDKTPISGYIGAENVDSAARFSSGGFLF